MADKTATWIERQRKHLLEKGYTSSQASLAISWAKNSAEGMSAYFGIPPSQLLRRYLRDTERWLAGCGIDTPPLKVDSSAVSRPPQGEGLTHSPS